METHMNVIKKWQTIAIASILVAVISLGGLLYTVARAGSAPEVPAAASAATEAEAATETTGTEVKTVDANEMLSLWNEGAPAREALTAYMESITKEGSPDFIPVENRIAVFDFDGTLFCETDPNYFDYTLLVYRVTEDPEYKDRASEFEKMVAAKIIDQNTNGTKYEELPMEHGQAVASAFKGMTMREFLDYIQEFKKQPMPSYEGMTRGGGFYEPMLQIINYLKANDFTVYVISGTDRFICRGIMENSPLELPNSQIIGSDETIVAGLQNGEDGLNYTFTQGDDLYLGGEFIIKNLKMNKVSVINSERDQQRDRRTARSVFRQHDRRRRDVQLRTQQQSLQEPCFHALLRRPRARERQHQEGQRHVQALRREQLDPGFHEERLEDHLC